MKESSSNDRPMNTKDDGRQHHSFHHIDDDDNYQTGVGPLSSLSQKGKYSNSYLPPKSARVLASNKSQKESNKSYDNRILQSHPNHPYNHKHQNNNNHVEKKLVENDLPMIMGAGSNKGSSGLMRHFDTNIFYSAESNEISDEERGSATGKGRGTGRGGGRGSDSIGPIRAGGGSGGRHQGDDGDQDDDEDGIADDEAYDRERYFAHAHSNSGASMHSSSRVIMIDEEKSNFDSIPDRRSASESLSSTFIEEEKDGFSSNEEIKINASRRSASEKNFEKENNVWIFPLAKTAL